MPELKFSIACAAAVRVAQTDVDSEQDAPARFPGDTATGVVLPPLQNSVSPATEVIMGIVAALL